MKKIKIVASTYVTSGRSLSLSKKVIRKKKTFSKNIFSSFFIIERDGGRHVLDKLFPPEKRTLFTGGNRFAKFFFSILDNFFGYGKERP